MQGIWRRGGDAVSCCHRALCPIAQQVGGGHRWGDTWPMAIASPVSDKYTTVALLLLTFATGLIDAVSVLVLGHVFVANMTGNGIFLGFMFLPHAGVDLTAVLVAFGGFLVGAILGGRFALSGTGVLDYYDNPKLILIAGLAIASGSQNAAARQCGVPWLDVALPVWPSACAIT